MAVNPAVALSTTKTWTVSYDGTLGGLQAALTAASNAGVPAAATVTAGSDNVTLMTVS